MKLLHIDTANTPLSVSVTDGIEVLAEFNSGKKINHSISLMPAIEYTMNYAQLEQNELEGIVVSAGPGSYTGLRIGAATAKTLAYTLNIPLYSVSSLKAIAATTRIHDYLLVPVIDARRDSVYTGIYRFKGTHIETVKEDDYMTIDSLNDYLKNQHMPYLFVGVDVEKLKAQLKGPTFYCLPRSSEMRRLIDLTQPVDVHTFEPAYLRVSEAERNWLNRQNSPSEK